MGTKHDTRTCGLCILDRTQDAENALLVAIKTGQDAIKRNANRISPRYNDWDSISQSNYDYEVKNRWSESAVRKEFENSRKSYAKSLLNRLKGEGIKFHSSDTPGELNYLRYAATELEVYGSGYPTSISPRHRDKEKSKIYALMQKWGATFGGDCPGENGYELCTAPAQGIKYIEQAKDYEEGFYADGMRLATDCGGHIHIDSRDFCFPEIARIILINAGIQDAIFQMLPAWRRNTDWCKLLDNRYSTPLIGITSAEDARVKFGSTFYAPIRNTRVGGKGVDRSCNPGRVGLNIASWQYRGTIEWRYPPGALHAEDMIFWAKLFIHIEETALQMSQKDAEKIASTTLDKSLDCLLSIIGSGMGLTSQIKDRHQNADKIWKERVARNTMRRKQEVISAIKFKQAIIPIGESTNATQQSA